MPNLNVNASADASTSDDQAHVSQSPRPLAANIPTQLKELPQWVAWRSDPPREPGGKRTKVPVDPKTGNNASTADSATWASFDEAIQRAATDSLAGVGFMLTLDAGIVGVDLDNCRDKGTGEIEPWALEVVGKLNSYTEISPSGTGVHILARGAMPGSGRRRGNVEMYCAKRYFTMTGVRVDGTPSDVEARSSELAEFHARTFGSDAAEESDASARAPRATGVNETPDSSARWVRASSAESLLDDELLDLACSAKNGDKLQRLFDGDAGSYGSASEADLGLCSMLAFWTGNDPERLDRLFRQSGLMRAKWDELRGERTYGAITIAKALSSLREIYTGGSVEPHWRLTVDGIDLDAKLGSDGMRATLTATGSSMTPFVKSVDLADEEARSKLAEQLSARAPDASTSIAAAIEELATVVGAAKAADAADAADGGSCASRVAALAIGAPGVELFHTPGRDDSEAYATITSGTGRETLRVRGPQFRDWLTKRFWEEYGSAPSATCVNDGVAAVAAAARYGEDSPAYPVHLRLARHGEEIWLDLCHEDGSAVCISASGWRVVPGLEVPVRFVRRRGLRPLPKPERGGNVEMLRPFVNLSEDTAWKLFICVMVTYFLPEGPYVVLVVNGEQGSAKSTLVRRLRDLIDPNAAGLRRPPQSERELMIAANNALVVSYDNLSGLSGTMSDALCSLATGAGFGARQLYSDDEEKLFEVARPVVLNGIDDVVTRPDLLDRAVVLTLPTIPDHKRQEQSVQDAEFAKVRASVLGKLLDGASAVLRIRPELKLSRKPRMADFTVSAVACASAFGWSQDEVFDAIEANRTEANEIAVSHSIVAEGIQKLLDEAPDGRWEGTATALLRQLAGTTERDALRRAGWPVDGSRMRGQLKRVATALRTAGIGSETRREGRSRTRIITLFRMSEGPSAPSASSADAPAGSCEGILGGRCADGDQMGLTPASAHDEPKNANGVPEEGESEHSADGADDADGSSEASEFGDDTEVF